MSTQGQILIGTAPRPNMMIGITHTADGRKVIRESKALKVGIGYPRGKAADVFVDTDGAWNIRVGKYGSDKKMKWETVAKFPTKDTTAGDARAKAEKAFRQAWKESDVCTYPRKVAFFQFTKPIMGEDGAEIYVPDFDAIEAYSFRKDRSGPPTEIDIIFLDDEPFTGGYQMWAASELKCSGDGENALRVLSMASTPEEKALAEESSKAGKKHFPVVGGCWTCNCPYAKETAGSRGPQPAPCKPGADIKFQLMGSMLMRVGGTAFFHTSSFRSISQIFSSIERIKELTGGRIAGIPLKMMVRSHKTNHNGQAAIQQNVAIEFRASDIDDLRKNLIEQAWKFRQATGIALPAATRMIEAAQPEDNAPMSAAAMAGEFYPEADEGEPVESEPIPPAAAATQAKTDALSDKIAKAKEGKSAAAPDPGPVVNVPAVALPAATQPVATQLTTPWSDRAGMNAAMNAQKSRIGLAAWESLMTKHSVMMGSLKHDDPKALALYTDAIAAPSVVLESDVF